MVSDRTVGKFISAQLDQMTQQKLLNELFQEWLMGEMQKTVSLTVNPDQS